MTTVRQDAWTSEEDETLARTILHQIRSGGTQLYAFQECERLLGRTRAACGYRWNAIVRKEYAAEIERAKTERQANRERLQVEVGELTGDREGDREGDRDFAAQTAPSRTRRRLRGGRAAGVGLTWEEVLRFLQEQQSVAEEVAAKLREVEAERASQTGEVERLAEENATLRAEVERLQAELVVMRDDYAALVQIMERARRMVVFGEPEAAGQSFRMDANGNLERVE